jgi:ABC-type taurine transport system substrate-binding protein
MSIQEVQIQRVSIVSTESFDTVIARIDAAIGHPDMVAFRKSFSAAQNEAEMKKVVDPITQPNGLMEFTRFSGKTMEAAAQGFSESLQETR